MTVTIGSIELRSTCTRFTVEVRNPFARAVRT